MSFTPSQQETLVSTGGEYVIERSARQRKESNLIVDRSERYRCATCGRQFQRRDALTRHLRIHDSNRPRPKSRKKACICCVRSKIKCLGERPSCTACIKRNQFCEYDTLRRARPYEPESGYQQDAASTNFQSIEDTMLSPLYDVTNTMISGDHSNGKLHRSGETTHAAPPCQPPALDFSCMMGDMYHPPALDSFAWIFENNQDEVFPSMPPSPNHELPALNHNFPFAEEQTQRAQHLSQEGYGVTALNEHSDDLPQPMPRNRCSPDDVWPMEWHAASDQRLTLPTLGSSCPSTDKVPGLFYNVTAVTEAARSRLSSSIRLPLEHVPWQTVSLANFPSNDQLDHCIDLYFRHFDQSFTVVHRPTFDPGTFPVLTLAMASVGANYTNFEGAHGFSTSLSELVRRLLSFMAEHDPRFFRSDRYLAAKLIQSVQGYCSASRRLFELSESSRSSLVHNARSMGLFCFESHAAPENLEVEDRWHHWINQENYRRLGWAVYLIDSSVSYLHNSRPYLSVSDIDMEMPSSNQHWEAETAHSWAALHPWADNAPPPLRFKPLCSSLLDVSANSIRKLDPRHHRYFILILVRMIWSLKEINGSPMSELGDVAEQLTTGGRHLHAILDRFLYVRLTLPGSATLTKMELANAYREAQMIHMSHIHGAGNLVGLLHAQIKNPFDEGPRLRMMEWAAQDAVRVRNVAYHSAQVLAILRNYQANFPLEPFSAFHAGAVLWCVTQFLPRAEDPIDGPGLRLDRSPTCAQDLAAAKAWISTGTPSRVGVFGVPDLAAEDGKTQVLEQTACLLRRMNCWGISQNFFKVVTALMSSGKKSS